MTINVDHDAFVGVLDHRVVSIVWRLQRLAHSILTYKDMSAHGQDFTHMAVFVGRLGWWWENLLHECFELANVVRAVLVERNSTRRQRIFWQAKSCAVNHLS